jgi:hypothetical protein
MLKRLNNIGRFLALAFAILSLLLDGCGTPRAREATSATAAPTSNRYHICASADCRTYNALPVIARRAKYGFACTGNVPPGSTPNPIEPPIEYNARDVGKLGFPPLNQRDLRTLKKIEVTNSSRSLKIAWLAQSRFLVFDDPGTPCGTLGVFKVINGECDEFYEPGENPYRTIPVPGEAMPACRSSAPPVPGGKYDIDFSRERNKHISDSDIEQYIDPRITGAQRKRAHELMKEVPSSQRANFVIYDMGGQVISNIWEAAQAAESDRHSLTGNGFKPSPGGISTPTPEPGTDTAR